MGVRVCSRLSLHGVTFDNKDAFICLFPLGKIYMDGYKHDKKLASSNYFYDDYW